MDAAQREAVQVVAAALQHALPNLGAAIANNLPPPPAPPAAAPAAAPAPAPPPATMKIRKFTGETPHEWRLWRQHFELVTQGNNWDERQKRVAIASNIHGRAHSRVSAIPNVIDPIGGGPCDPAADLLDLYEQRFMPQDITVAREDFAASCQSPDESLMAWSSRMVFLHGLAYPGVDAENDPTAITHFWKKLHDRKLVDSVGKTSPQTLNQATQTALKHLQVNDYRSQLNKGAGHNPELYKKMYAMGGEKRESPPSEGESTDEDEEGVNATRRPPSKKKSKTDGGQKDKDKDRETVCWNCGQTGHIRRDCNAPAKNTNQGGNQGGGRSGRGKGRGRGRGRGRGGRRGGGRGGNSGNINQIVQAAVSSAVNAVRNQGEQINAVDTGAQGNF